MLPIVLIISSLLLVAIDQLTKYLAVVHLKGNEGIPLIDGVFELVYVENKGAAFGMMQNARWFFIILTAVILIAMIVFLVKGVFRGRNWMIAASTMIIAGGIGNLIDRIVHGYVVDFFYFRLIDFPVFNFADCLVVVGALLLLVQVLFFYDPKAQMTSEGEKTDGTKDVNTESATGADAD